MTCEGSDVQLQQVPTPAWLPANIRIRQWNMFDPPPVDMVGRFDLVHARLISICIKDGDPTPLIENFKRLLSKCKHTAPYIPFFSNDHERTRRMASVGRDR